MEDHEFGVAHDRWLAGYRRERLFVWCSNPECSLHRDGTPVTYEVEYGQGSCDPEECWLCLHPWVFDEPKSTEEEEDE
jgi:hypothetical protein